jgi:hypothetical protein
MLPIKLVLFRRKSPTEIEKIGELNGKETIEKVTDEKGVPLKPGDLVHFLYPNFAGSATGPYFEVLSSEMLRADSRNLRIGDIVYQSIEPSFFLNSHADISGVNIHNHLSMPIEVWNEGRKLAYVRADDRKGYLGGHAISKLEDLKKTWPITEW